MKTPIVFIIFNRPTLTQKVFNEIKKAKPAQLFIISDGPRNEKERELINETRKIIDRIDWKCEVYKKYSETNLGCKISVSSGLDWVFSKVDQAIILEDDCVPDQSFFPYCEELLERYRNNKKIMMVSGDNFFKTSSEFSYNFCHHSLIWGWATWRRSWVLYKKACLLPVEKLEENRSEFQTLVSGRRLDAIKKTIEGKIDTWDYMWQYAMLLCKGLCIYPSVNLVRNIGFGNGATHTKYKTFHSKLSQSAIQFPLVHPNRITPNISFDSAISKTYHPFYSLIDVISHFFQ
ncbi:hemolytic protein HlpA-like protein [Candidatus Roizmanbacteria bacterium CG_4_10_14_0_8_um_filter_39_9]|uniref:Hemolytic protein HlpA-like protein n=1 Tax=Candidatus Roizmanbacteria bacterium CG_4_10_14_0_8_um_filter_39_9 TaxID=1974829 RepID=A0A2M7QDD1_9BACT|nr:MAG: hemolytic protein HlpA-like protein [Candidatus Roizmanbacteria bacterium CG_4_10_14_0_8_um_filter_39_9]